MNNKTIFKWFSMLLLMMLAGISSVTAQSLALADFSIKAGGTRDVTISLVTENDIYGIQTDIVLSEGLSLEGQTAVDENLSFASNIVVSNEKDATRVSLLSLEGKAITAGDAITLTVKADDSFTGGTIMLTNTRLTTDTRGTEQKVGDVTANIIVINTMEIRGTFPGMSWSEGVAMVQDTENPAIWTVTLEGVDIENGTYEYKAFANGETTGYQLPAEGNQNWVFAENSDYPAGKYNLVFTADTDNHKLTIEPQGPDAPELVAPEGCTNGITNGNLAGEDVSSYYAQGTDPVAITPGAGKGGSRGIVVKSADNPSAADWDTQFFIVLSETLQEGTTLHVQFDYKAKHAATAGTQAHGNPGDYNYWSCLGNVEFTEEWKTFSQDIEISAFMAHGESNGQPGTKEGFRSIAFNLAVDKTANEYYFDNFGVWYQKPAVVDDWTDIVVNGDMEGESAECFYVTEQGIGGPFLANITEGIGKDGSKAVKVESYNDPAQDWDSQFFIRLPYQIPAGTQYKVSFDYKADKAGDFDTQAHTEPGGYIHWACIGSGSFTDEWQTYTAEGTITADMSKEGQLMQTIAFNLAKNKVATCFVFDNVKFLVPTDVVPTLTLNPAQNPTPYNKPVYTSMAIVGDFLGLEATEEDANPSWNPANGWEMTQDAENDAVWTLVKDEFTAEAKTYEYKATANGNWDDYVLPAGDNANYNFDTPNLGAGKYKLTFTVDTRKHSVNLDVEKLDVTTYTATFTTDADWEEVYAYTWSGEGETKVEQLGAWPGTKLEAVEGVYTVSIEATDAPEMIIFNNGNSGEGNQTRDLEFVNGGAYEYKKPTGEEAAVKLAPEGWTLATTNGNLAGDDANSYVMKEYPSTDIVPAAIEAGAGTDGSRGIVVRAGDDTANDNYAAWDSQFWIQLAEAVPAGTKLHVEFDYKASQEAKATTQAHNTPGAYQHWGMIGDVNFTTEWQTFSADIEVNDAMAGTKTEDGVTTVGPGLLTIAFNLQEEKSATNYYFDNFGVWYQKPVTIESMAIVGDFLGLEATEEDTNPNWNPANGWAMEQDAENPAIWTVTKPFTAEAKTYEYKATANGKWGDYELPAEGNQNFVFGTDEYPAGDYKLVFTADTENNTLDLVVKPSTLLTFTATFTTNAYWWDDVYAYAWSGEGENAVKYLGDWPGTKLKVNADGIYTVNVEGEVAPEKIIFNNGNTGEGNQTEDLEFVAEKAYEYVFTPTFDFENNNGQWAENETFANGATMGEVTLTGVKNVKYMNGQLRIGNRTGSFKLTAPEGKSIAKIELKVLKANEINLTPSTGEVAKAKELTQGDEENSTVVYSIWTWTGADAEVSFDLKGAMQRNLGFINVTLGNEWTDAIAAAKALAEEDGVAVGKLLAAIDVAQGISEPTEDDKAALQAAVDQYKTDNLDQEKDETAKVATNGWKKFDGTAAGVCSTDFAPAITTYDGREAQMAEVYETNGNRTGTIIYQDITGLTNGKYKVGFYGNAFSTSQRDGFECTMEDGATDVAYVFANEEKEYISARITTATTENDFRQFDVEVTDGNIKLGMGKDTEKSTNWHTIQIYQLTWFTTAKEVYAMDQDELVALLAEAKALAADESKTEGKDDLNNAITASESGVGSNWYNIPEIEEIIADLKTAMENFKKANWFIDFAAGEYYVIHAQEGLKMAAGHDWGTRGIVNDLGLDLTLTPYEQSRTVTFNSRVYNNDNDHFLGSNLYMDSSEWGWALENQGGGFFYILNPNDGKYINIDNNFNLVLSDTPCEWIIVSKEGVRAELLEVMAGASKENPVDATGLIVAQNFNRNDARNAEAWIVSEDCTNRNLSGGNNLNNCAESFHSTFTIMQTISDCPAGFYQLTAQGFYRQDEFEGDAPAAPVFFANEINGDVPARAEGGPNGMSTASEAFTNGDYTIDPINFEVKEDGMMYIGITASTNTQWVIWDNFQLKYFGQENPTTGITTVVVPVAQNDAIYNLNGQKVTKAQKGLYIINGKKQVVK